MRTYTSYHLFGDEWDEWYSTRKEANEAYKKAVHEANGYINLRLYKTISSDDDSTETEEEYIKGRGDFPW